MIPLAHITQWRNIAPWPDDLQVEQDLLLSRLLIEIFSDPLLNKALAFRGGTALHKLFFSRALRYSEDIDLVRTSTGPIKSIIDALRNRLDPLLGEPNTRQTQQSFKLLYYFNPEGRGDVKLRIKIEINIRESFYCFSRQQKHFNVQSNWFNGSANINTYEFSELIATKLRALYQRRKGRDLFDLQQALKHPEFELSKVIQAFEFYMKKEDKMIKRDDFLKNIEAKLKHRAFTDDIAPLLSPELKQSHSSHVITGDWNLHDASKEIEEKLIAFLPE